MPGRDKNSQRGFTMIEAAFVLFLFSVITLTFAQLFSLGTKRIMDVRRKLGATTLADERMEIIRSLPYDSIGTKNPNGSGGWSYGIPRGDILETETIDKPGAVYSVHTMVQYVDDPFDGTASGTGSNHDAIPTDYKQARIEVTWPGAENGQSVIVWGTFSPNGVEQPSNTGVLSVNVVNGAGAGVSGANVHIVSATNAIDLTAQTDDVGNQSFPGSPPGTDYMISVSKSGYYGVRTYLPTSSLTPLDPPMSVVAGAVNMKSLFMDQTSDITIRSEDMFGTAIPNVAFTISGGHQIGTQKPVTNPLVPVYDFSASNATGSDGQKTYAASAGGGYTLAPSNIVSGYMFLRVDPGIKDKPDFFDIVAGTNQTAKMVFAKSDIASVIFTVTSGSGASTVPVPSASVELKNVALGYDTTVITGNPGQAYFPAALSALSAGTYEYAVSASGYANKTGTVTVSTVLTQQPVTIVAQ